jgi:hypothetical protein
VNRTRNFCVAAAGAALLGIQAGCMTTGYSYAKDPKLVGKKEVTITKLEPQNIYDSMGVAWVGPFAKVESRGQRVAFVDAQGKSVELVQPHSDRYELHVGQKVMYVVDRGQVWVQPLDYPLPPEFGTQPQPVAAAAAPYESAVRLELPTDWEKKALTDQMKAAGAILYAVNLTNNSAVELSANKRGTVTDTKTFAESREAAAASAIADGTRSGVVPVDVAGHPAYRFEVSGTLIGKNYRATFCGYVVEGSTEIAYFSAWTTAENFDKQRDAFAQLATQVTGL